MDPSVKLRKLKFLVVFPILAITVLSGSVFALSEKEHMHMPAEETVFEELLVDDIYLEESLIDDIVLEEFPVGDIVLQESPAEEQAVDEASMYGAFASEMRCGTNSHHNTEYGRHNRRGRMWQH